jgi:hypothetical protein
MLKELIEDIGPRQPGRPTGRRAFSDEECNDYARRALELRATTPPTRWADIEKQLSVSARALRDYIKALPSDKKDSNASG